MQIKNKRFLIIGGAGFIGSHLTDLLLKEDIKEVIVFDNFSRGSLSNLKEAQKDKRLKIVQGDILHRDILDKYMQNIDGVFHLAAVWLLHCYDFPETAFEVNIKGTFNVLMSALKNKVKKIVYSSSASVYGNALEIPMTENHPYNNETFYGATKIASEHIIKSLACRYGIEWIGLRYMNVYGERQDYQGAYTAVMHKILDKLNENQSPVIYGDGSQVYDFVYVTDVARANILAMKSKQTQGFYNVGTEIGTSLNDLTKLMIKLSEKNLPIKYETAGTTFVTNRIGSNKQAKKDLKFIPQIDIKEGMSKLINWRNNQ